MEKDCFVVGRRLLTKGTIYENNYKRSWFEFEIDTKKQVSQGSQSLRKGRKDFVFFAVIAVHGVLCDTKNKYRKGFLFLVPPVSILAFKMKHYRMLLNASFYLISQTTHSTP